MEKLDSPRRGVSEQCLSTSSTSSRNGFIKSLLQVKQPWFIICLLILWKVATIRKKNIYIIFICELLMSTVVSGIHYHDHHSHNHNQSADSVRRSRYSGLRNGSASAFTMRPEFNSVPIGGVIHLFPRYGYLSLSMRVISRNTSNTNSTSSNNDSWMFLEPVNNVMERTTVNIEETTFEPVDETDSMPFQNVLHFDLCEDVNTLMEAYFRNFTIEGLDKPWIAFAGGWRSTSIARNFGINLDMVEGDYRYALVKVLLVRSSGVVETTDNTTVSDSFKGNFQNFEPDNDLSAYQFFRVVGTHYIHSYVVGNAMYQVFVYDPDGFHAIKKRLLLGGIEDSSTTGNNMEFIIETLMQWVKQVGRVIILNSEPSVTETVRNSLMMPYPSAGTPFPNLLKLHNNASVVKEVEMLLVNQLTGIISIDFKGIQFLFKDPVQRAGFEKVLKHRLQLWEINLLY